MVSSAADDDDDTACTELSEKTTEGDDELRTVESLRGRLLAERAASSAAKKDAELMDNKLKELERQLKIEIKARRREEKRLNSLKKKVESLNIVRAPGNSEESERRSRCSSEDKRGEPQRISAAASGGFEESPEEELVELGLKNGSGNNCSKALVSGNAEAPEDEAGSSCLIQESPAESNSDDHSMKSCPVMEMGNKNEHEDYNNAMALVPAVMPGEDRRHSSNEEAKKDAATSGSSSSSSSENVREILDTLKQIKERLQSSIGDRRRGHVIIKVG